MDPERRVAKALEDAQGILARYVEPGPRDCEQTINKLLSVLDDETVVQALKDSKMEKPTTEQLDELKRLSAIARVPDESEIVTSKEEAEIRIRDLKDKARME
ncbi:MULTISPECIES: hypothetical protein [Bradyrhizobium]|uniref:Terminase small subunit n=1 Tax=Bradyrhizobium ottawaense TaxID=931866 RepID=A0ABV4FP33_9BRAD|nr:MULTISPECIES: hypothetical protein [Bradyrhizobium]MBR1292849.1 hypothetical protein [Bradyrhizobium ottawaense]MBR1335292.1 hypothetical protein [Bradyrhizobium ottawaense]MDT4738392.1 hypothetical protein [Bradyrhizobium sp. WYCCWR 12699]WLB45965.1 hypothetical protein QIH93_36745 [Bradyrhizobium ottawaense]WQN83253.1 hypothetical protein U7859_01875 [Bradyrhizobium ottawaense]